METRYTINFTLYSHQLNEPHKSFDLNLKLKDFRYDIQEDLKLAKKVTYVDPRGEKRVLK